MTCSPFPIGRKKDQNLLILDDERVSRRHAQLQCSGHDWYIEDVGSANGVFVNERRVSKALLRGGDQIELGSFRLVFHQDGAAGRREDPAEDLGELVRDERFDFLEEIGRGGMAVVYKAALASNGKLVAVKVPLLDFAEGNGEILDRFRGEAMLTLRLRHPHIVRVLHEGRLDDERPFIVMEYLPGGSLRRLMAPGRPLPEDVIGRIGMQVADALAYAHDSRVIHRDIKPENLLFGEHQDAKITDFGIAIIEGNKRLTQAGPPVGTFHYQSPEQFRGQTLTAKSDLYALGCMMYEMSTGRCPFEGSYAAVVHGHLDEAPEDVRRRNPQISPFLSGQITALLAKSPARRPANAHRVADQLASHYRQS